MGFTKIFLPISGLLLVLFLIFHLGGLVLAVISPADFELYASALHSSSWVRFFELVLIIVVVMHMVVTFIKVINNYQTGNSSNLVSRRNDFLAVFAARSQSIGGVILLVFLLIHLGQLRFPRPPDGAELSTLQGFLNSPMTLMIYSLGLLSMFLHVFHGIESSQRTLGILTSKNASLIRGVGRSLSLLLGIGYVLLIVFLRAPSLSH